MDGVPYLPHTLVWVSSPSLADIRSECSGYGCSVCFTSVHAMQSCLMLFGSMSNPSTKFPFSIHCNVDIPICPNRLCQVSQSLNFDTLLVFSCFMVGFTIRRFCILYRLLLIIFPWATRSPFLAIKWIIPLPPSYF